MIELLEILIISVLQGISEFLPISSSGHNAVTDHLFERFGQPLTEGDADFIKLNVLLHFGTLIAVLVVFRQRIFDLFRKDWHLIPMLLIATIPAVLVGLPIKKFAPWIETDLYIISICFIGTGILLLSSLRRPEGEKTCSTMSFLDGLIIGFSQAAAILPGLSRSGTTIVTGLFCKLKREEAATFSFLLSIPVIAGSGILELKDLFGTQPANTPSGGIPNWLLLLGMAVSCGVGILALTWLLDWLKKGKLWYFALWVFLMAPVTFALAILPMPEKQVQTDSTQTVTETNNQPQTDKIFLQKTVATMETPVTKRTLVTEGKAKEKPLIAEERISLVDDADKPAPFDTGDRIWVTPDGSVVLLGGAALREGFLKLLTCRIGTKERESILFGVTNDSE